MNPRNRYLEAFKESFNVLGLTTAVAASAALLNPLPLLVGLVAEAAYILFYADSRWYQARLARRHDAEVQARREQLKRQVLPTLRPAMQARFVRLEEVRRDIDDQAGDQQWFREVLRKLDFLLEKFLQFASKDAQFREHLESVLRECEADGATTGTASGNAGNTDSAAAAWRARQLDPRRRGLAGTLPPTPDAASPGSRLHSASNSPGSGSFNSGIASQRLSGLVPVPPSPPASRAAASQAQAATRDPADRRVRQTVSRVQSHYDRDLEGIRQMSEQESDPATRAVLEKRREVLQRRREFVGKIGRIQTNLHHQLSLLEDTFGLISDEIRARPPEQVLADIEDVVSQTNTMTQLLEEVAPYEQLLAS